jgi:hypothetical protein
VQADPAVAVLVVVVAHESLGEGAGVGDRAEPVRERGAVLQGLERGLAVGVVVGHVRPAVAAYDAEVDEQLGDRLGGHRGAPVGVDRQRVATDLLAGQTVRNQVLGELPGLRGRKRPANDVTAVDVEDDVEVVVDPAVRTAEFGDAP